MDSFNWLEFIDSFHKQATHVNCSYRVTSHLFFSSGSFAIGSFDFPDSFGSFGSFGSFSCFDYEIISKQPLNMFGYGIDLI